MQRHFRAARVFSRIKTENLGKSGFIDLAKRVLCRAKYETGSVKKDCNVVHMRCIQTYLVLNAQYSSKPFFVVITEVMLKIRQLHVFLKFLKSQIQIYLFSFQTISK